MYLAVGVAELVQYFGGDAADIVFPIINLNLQLLGLLLKQLQVHLLPLPRHLRRFAIFLYDFGFLQRVRGPVGGGFALQLGAFLRFLGSRFIHLAILVLRI